MVEILFQIIDSINNYHPLVWALSVMLVIAVTAISLHFFWDVTLKAIIKILNRRNPFTKGS